MCCDTKRMHMMRAATASARTSRGKFRGAFILENYSAAVARLAQSQLLLRHHYYTAAATRYPRRFSRPAEEEGLAHKDGLHLHYCCCCYYCPPSRYPPEPTPCRAAKRPRSTAPPACDPPLSSLLDREAALSPSPTRRCTRGRRSTQLCTCSCSCPNGATTHPLPTPSPV